MRDIKFRAWHKGYAAKGKFSVIEPRMLYDDKIGDCLGYAAQRQPVEIMQFTGLQDKNGVDIYEGDIVKVPNRKMKAKKVPFYTTEIIYRGHAFTLKNNDTYFVDNACIGRYLEVIGNIYQNKELL